MKQCNKCHKNNRDQAVYCRFCGDKLPVAEAPRQQTHQAAQKSKPSVGNDVLDDIVGMEPQKAQLRELIDTLNTIRNQRGAAALQQVNSNILITGPSGSGKTTLLSYILTYLQDNKLATEENSALFTPLTIENYKPDEQDFEVVALDDAHKCLPPDKSDELTGTPLDFLVEMARLTVAGAEDRFVLMLSGNQELQDYVDARPELKNLFALNIRLPEYSPTEVAAICESILQENYQLGLSDEAREKLARIFNYERRNSEKFGNAHLAKAKANEIMMAVTRRSKGQATTAQVYDISGKEYVPKTLEEVMAEFDKYVGVDEIKQTMVGIVNSIQQFQRLNPGKTFQLKDHYRFVGNPGTGKTTMARVFADALAAMGILPSGQLVEVAPKDLKGMYQGHTGPAVDDAFNRAMGGVLFIDEAYDLWGGDGDTFGKEAVTALIKNVEDRRGKLIVILAGYTKEMDQFSQANPGIKSRFNVTIPFRDYNGAELTEIARRMIKSEGYTLDEGAERVIGKVFEKMYVSRQKDFGNARDVRNAVSEAIKAQNNRVSKGVPAGQEFIMTKGDLTGDGGKEPLSVNEVLAKLDDLIGMDEIKAEIRKLANVARVNRMRMERGLGAAALQPVNIILTGNPGTGKTTIAKRLGEVLNAAGVLPTDKVVEREAKSILSSYVNDSGRNMEKAVDEAMGAVLFIDEAYNLLPQPGSTNNTGNEALDALMTRMENDKGKFCVVIAGYKDRMEDLLRRGNPGLMSRFNKNFHIEDYDAEALMQIFLINVKKRKFTLTPAAESAVRMYIEAMVANKRRNFGNAREVVNLLNEIVELQGNRIAADFSIIDTNPDALTTIEVADIPR